MSGVVHYDYAGIGVLTAQLTGCKTVAETLQQAGTATKVQMESSWTGTASMSFSDAYQRFDQVQTSTIETCESTIRAINQGTGDFQAGEQVAAGGYG